ncbi:MAG: NAD(P)-binding domain-containing protein [Candidatus Omnitrophica bacterium]|nr:NAD(P)-binding domain-containing protein [Candidatus Omnitrophota bacterium]
MPDNNLTQIRISRVIPAPKWRILRLLTRVWEFPNYIPSVKEASVVKRKGNYIITKWQIQVDNIPIMWTEEEIIDFNHNAIYFRAIEGDLSEFYGEWNFNLHPEGTEVAVNVNLKVDIPAIQTFAQDYVRKMVTKNFEIILNALESRLVSVKYTRYKQGWPEKIAGFGIVGHLYNFNHLERCLKMLNPNFKMPSREFIGRLFHITPSFKLYDILNFKSKTGQTVNGCFIVATFIPDMIEKDIWSVFSKVVRACKIAEKYGVGIVTLGGFTSIVAERIGQEISSEVDVPVTTGNTFTAAMAIDGVLKGAELLGKDISTAKVTIIGGTGDIGSACARVLTDKAKQITITGRTKTNLKRMYKQLSARRKAKIIATTNNEAAVRDADIVIAAAAVSSSILKIDWFKPGAIICDVGYPKNISHTPTSRKDILIFSGGLAKSPTPFLLPIDTGLPDPNVVYGCFAEAIILALERRYENFSFGRGNITPAKIEEIRQLGLKHGFAVADFYWGDKLVDETVIGEIKDRLSVKVAK